MTSVGAKIEELRASNYTFAASFNNESIPTARGGKWYGTTVRNYYNRYKNKNAASAA